MSAAEGGPSAIAYLTALLHGDPKTAHEVVRELDTEQVIVAFSCMSGAIFGLLNAIAHETGADYVEMRDDILRDMGTALAGQVQR